MLLNCGVEKTLECPLDCKIKPVSPKGNKSWIFIEKTNVGYLFDLIKLLEENIGKTLSDINHSRILYDPPPRILEIKAKINKWNLIKIERFCTIKETISKMKRQPSEWEKITANEATDKQLISKIYKQLMQLNSRKINYPIKKWAKELNRHFFWSINTVVYFSIY